MRNEETIKKIAEEFFERATFAVDVSVKNTEDANYLIKAKTDDPKMLIGQNGQVLAEIQKLLRALVKKDMPEGTYIELDINDYKEKKSEYLRETAKETADEVSLTGKEKSLSPMSSYERRIIHMELSARTDVVTESRGEDPDRRIVVKPA
ncbi:MAG: hypothetical protein A2365_00230 [Candidatus Nealsonbacteria bacterium RIFOXYB1_FULL_40_15]|uniref:R3H domain-containing protein n=2 Tax=Candidatus Nealsoniibacteriota TaxID=1817911 RepID=A0A1G2ESC6_9BACT|nr:MAG: hypothetical protein A2365_00230 [Candidatus Nealsonbacteria bacterium RIFOXYB1_FULL_40_15]OGZ28714.1 MAG: hypothetical protein A2427_03505 [Candidatus Nealsonbacteria bacterium RIFOXYC1_FULL_40_7]OGZ29169.1 MAG: hypothetical protein A2562_01235 [Candidatus Nealsonbacteria bacterium RIFOXYD1_FULL_39_11]